MGDLEELVGALWGGFSQSLVCEKGNTELRDSEVRDNSSKTMARIRRWHTLVGKGPIEQFERTPPPASDLNMPSPQVDSSYEDFFCHAHKHDKEHSQLKRIFGQQTWQTWSPQTIQRSYGEMSLMVRAFQSGSPNLVEESWVTWFLPEFCVIIERNKAGTQGFFVLHKLGTSALVWPCRRRGDHLIELEADPAAVNELRYITITDFDEVFVLPTSPCSPLHTQLLGFPSNSAQLMLHIRGKPIKLLDHCASIGFPNVPETALRMLYSNIGKVPIEHDKKACNSNTEEVLACGLVSHFMPKATDQAIATIIADRRLTESFIPAESDTLDSGVMYDVLLLNDRRDLASAEKAQAQAWFEMSQSLLSGPGRLPGHLSGRSKGVSVGRLRCPGGKFCKTRVLRR